MNEKLSQAALENYVRVTLAMQGYAFDEAQIAEIQLQFSRINAVAQTFLQLPFPLELEAATVFRP